MPLQNEFIDERIAHYHEQLALALETIELIDVRGWRFYEGHGDEKMHDVTDERRAKQQQTVEQLETLIAAYVKQRAT